MTAPTTDNRVRSAVVRMLMALATKPHSYAELAAISRLDERSVRMWIKALHGARPAMVSIGDWREDALGRKTIAAFVWGFGAIDIDMPKPAAKSRARITAEYRARKAAA